MNGYVKDIHGKKTKLMLLIPQRVNGIKERGFVRGIEPEEDPYESGKAKGE